MFSFTFSRNFFTLASTGVLALSLASTVASAQHFHTWEGALFGPSSQSACHQELEAVVSRIRAAGKAVIDYQCRESRFGGTLYGYVPQIRFDADFGHSALSFKMQLRDLPSCESQKQSIEEKAVSAGFVYLSSYCRKGEYNGSALVLDYFEDRTSGTRRADLIVDLPSYPSAQECEQAANNFQQILLGYNVLPLAQACHAFSRGSDLTKAFYRAELAVAIESGKRLTNFAAKTFSSQAACLQEIESALPKIRLSGLVVPYASCHDEGTSYSFAFTSLEGLLSRVDQFHSLSLDTSLESCEQRLANASAGLVSAGRNLVYGYCNSASGFSAPVGYQFNIYYLRPPVIIPETVIPEI